MSYLMWIQVPKFQVTVSLCLVGTVVFSGDTENWLMVGHHGDISSESWSRTWPKMLSDKASLRKIYEITSSLKLKLQSCVFYVFLPSFCGFFCVEI